MALLCRTPLQVQRIAWEALKQGFEEGEQPISRETILNGIVNLMGISAKSADEVGR